MGAFSLRILTRHARLGGSVQQVITRAPPAHGSVQQQNNLCIIRTGTANPYIACAADLVECMAQVLVKLRLYLHMHGQRAVAVVCQQFERRPQQICAEPGGEFFESNGQRFMDGPAAGGAFVFGVHRDSFQVMSALYVPLLSQATPSPGICLDGLSSSISGAFQ